MSAAGENASWFRLYVDGLKGSELSQFTRRLRALHIETRKVRGVRRDESEPLIRLAGVGQKMLERTQRAKAEPSFLRFGLRPKMRLLNRAAQAFRVKALFNRRGLHDAVVMSTEWAGLFCALWTPTDEQGQLMESALVANIEFLKTRRAHGLLALGSTGEFLYLDPKARFRVIERVAETAAPLRLIVNISDLRPRVVADLGRLAKQAGAQAVSVLPPHFYPMAQEDLADFFSRAADAAQLPLFLYNFPERTGNRIGLETVAAVADRAPVAGVKQSGSEFAYHTQLVQLGREKGFVVLTGADTRLPEAVALGVSGCVSGLSNAVPELVLDALESAGKGAPSVAAERLGELGRRIQAVCFPLDVATVMAARGLPVGSSKSIISSATRSRCEHLRHELKELFREWNLV
jgi:4-hydroxy-tetrahydrodipicolinate synthase